MLAAPIDLAESSDPVGGGEHGLLERRRHGESPDVEQAADLAEPRERGRLQVDVGRGDPPLAEHAVEDPGADALVGPVADDGERGGAAVEPAAAEEVDELAELGYAGVVELGRPRPPAAPTTGHRSTRSRAGPARMREAAPGGPIPTATTRPGAWRTAAESVRRSRRLRVRVATFTTGRSAREELHHEGGQIRRRRVEVVERPDHGSPRDRGPRRQHVGFDVDPARPGGGGAAKQIEAVALAPAEPAAVARPAARRDERQRRIGEHARDRADP